MHICELRPLASTRASSRPTPVLCPDPHHDFAQNNGFLGHPWGKVGPALEMRFIDRFQNNFFYDVMHKASKNDQKFKNILSSEAPSIINLTGEFTISNPTNNTDSA
jgi:hypothetical protein